MTHDPAALAAGAAMSRPTCATCPWWERGGGIVRVFGWCDHADARLVSPSGEVARQYTRGDRDTCHRHPDAKDMTDGT